MKDVIQSIEVMARVRAVHDEMKKFYADRELASALGVSTATISNIFNENNTKIKKDYLIKLAEKWDINPDYLMCKHDRKSDFDLLLSSWSVSEIDYHEREKAVISSFEGFGVTVEKIHFIDFDNDPTLLLTPTEIQAFNESAIRYMKAHKNNYLTQKTQRKLKALDTIIHKGRIRDAREYRSMITQLYFTEVPPYDDLPGKIKTVYKITYNLGLSDGVKVKIDTDINPYANETETRYLSERDFISLVMDTFKALSPLIHLAIKSAHGAYFHAEN